MLVPVWYVRDIEQGHSRLLGRAVGLAGVAPAARRDRIGPAVAPAARHRKHMIARQVAGDEPLAAVGAQVPIARKKQRVGQARGMGEFPRAAALDRQDRLGGDARAHAVLLVSAAKLAHDVAYRPGNQLLGMISNRFLQLDPGLREAGKVDSQDQRLHGICSRVSAYLMTMARFWQSGLGMS